MILVPNFNPSRLCAKARARIEQQVFALEVEQLFQGPFPLGRGDR
jgi:hypothetical protein